ncbi:MAG: DUF1015 domain-containing protein [Acidobacteriota bacterium]
MPRIEGFRGWRYQLGERDSLGALITPPYDVISPLDRERLSRSHPHNFVRLILPRKEHGMDPYQAAAARFRRWCQSGVLVRDQHPSLTIHRQSFVSSTGQLLTRTGLLGTLPLEERAMDSVLPHENTMAGPRRDRQKLMEAVGAHLSPIFLLAPDPGGDFHSTLEAAAAAHDELDFTDEGGVRHRVSVQAESTFAGRVAEILGTGQLIIADGHHRFLSSVACYQAMRSAAGARSSRVREAGRVLVEVVSMASPGLCILPIHRGLRGLHRFHGEEFLRRLRQRFSVTSFAGDPSETQAAGKLVARVLESSRGTVGLALAGCTGLYLVQIPPPQAPSSPLEPLDVSLLHHRVLGEELQLSAAQPREDGVVTFHHDARQLLEAVRSGSIECAFFLRPTSLDDLQRVTSSGMTMPQKSTFFHPKIPAGIVVHSFS